jgi:hypothetical protein
MPSVNDLVTAKSLQSPLTQLRVGVESRKDEAVRSHDATEMELMSSLNRRFSIDHYRIRDPHPPMRSPPARLEHLHCRPLNSIYSGRLQSTLSTRYRQ